MHSSSEWFVAVAPALQAENLRCLFIELMVDEKLFQGRVGSLRNPAAGWGASATPPSSCLKPPPPSLSAKATEQEIAPDSALWLLRRDVCRYCP